MKVAELQQFLSQIIPFVKAAKASETVTTELTRAVQALEPFKEKPLTEFNEFLRMAEEYYRTGLFTRKGAKKATTPKVPKLTIADAAQKFLSLYERATDPALDYAIIDAEISRFNDLSIDQLKVVAKEVNQTLPVGKSKKPEIVAAFKRMIKEQKENFERNQPQPAPEPTV